MVGQKNSKLNQLNQLLPEGWVFESIFSDHCAPPVERIISESDLGGIELCSANVLVLRAVVQRS